MAVAGHRPRLLVVGVKQETASFNPVATTLADFEVVRGSAAHEALAGTATEVGGIIAAAEGRCDLVLGTIAWALSGGEVTWSAFNQISRAIVTDVVKAKVDGVLVVLHGSMITARTRDPEGALLTAIRRAVGNLPIVATLDLHAVLTPRMLRAADVLVPFHTYPHTDHAPTGVRAFRAMHRLLASPCRVRTAVVRVPLLARGDELITATGLFGKLVSRCAEWEQEDDVLSAGILIGNPFTDVRALASNVFVSFLGGQRQADRPLHVERLGRLLWQERARLTAAELTPVPDAVELAGQGGTLTVLSDQADATSSGAAGDSIAILAELVRQEVSVASLVPVVDAEVALAAMEAGVGARISLPLGREGHGRDHTIDLTADVIACYPDSTFSYEDGTVGRAGHTAVLRMGEITILVTARRVWVVGRRVYEEHGLLPQDFAVVVVKSPNGFRTHYDAIAGRSLHVDAPGDTTANLAKLPYQRVTRPIYPLDLQTRFRGAARMYESTPRPARLTS